MTELELIQLWNKSRNQLIFAQLAPTFLLITTVGLVPAIKSSGTLVVFATIGILLASGILGALVEFSAANEAQAIARQINVLTSKSGLGETIIKTAPWLHIAKYLTPAIFVAIFVFLLVALLG